MTTLTKYDWLNDPTGTTPAGATTPTVARSQVTYSASGSSTTEWLSVVLAPLLRRTAADAQKRQLTLAGDSSVIPLVYGEDRVGAKILNVVPSGANVLIQCLWALAGDSVNDVKYNDLALPSGASSTDYTGSQVSVDSGLAAAFSAQGITYAEALTGYMYSVITMPQSAFSGSLNFSARIKGRKCFDPRKAVAYGGSGSHVLGTPSTWEWTDCPALHLADFLYSSDYGCNKTVDWTVAKAAANANDALVGGEKRRLSGIAFVDKQPAPDVAETLRAYASCFMVPGSSGIKLIADEARATDATYAHASGQIANLVRVSKKDVGNVPTVVEVKYTDTAVFPWRDASAVVEASGVDTTLPRRTSVVPLPGIHRYSQAYREATERLAKLRTADLEVVVDVFDTGIKHEIGDVIEVTHPVGLSSKKLRIGDPESLGNGIWRLTGSEYDPAAYSDSVPSTPTYADTNLVNPTLVPPNMTSLSVAVLADGTRRFTAVAPTGVPVGSKIVVRYVTGSSSTWSAMTYLFEIAYDPNRGTYYYETSLPVEGTWSFGAKIINAFGTECATATFITAAVLTTHPKRYDSTFNMLKNADWTVSLGANYDYPNTFTVGTNQPLANWEAGVDGGMVCTVGRNFDSGKRWNIGAGGFFFYSGTNQGGAGKDAYLISSAVPVQPNEVYEASVYYAAHRCAAGLGARWVDSTGGYTYFTTTTENAGTANVGNELNPMLGPRFFLYGTAPGSAAYLEVLAVKFDTTTGLSDSYAFFHKAQACKWGGGTSAAEALPWVPPTGVESGGVNTGNLGPNAATEVYTAQSSGTGDAYWYSDGTSYTTLSQSCSVAVPVDVGDRLLLHGRLSGSVGNATANLPYSYPRLVVDAKLPGGTGTQYYHAGSNMTGNLLSNGFGEQASANNNAFQLTHELTIATSGTATAYAGGGMVYQYGTFTESGQVFLRVERVRR